jgi:hypothetical protein
VEASSETAAAQGSLSSLLTYIIISVLFQRDFDFSP